jgi:pimeloyl-ACP methyl ester carboxylesterase
MAKLIKHLLILMPFLYLFMIVFMYFNQRNMLYHLGHESHDLAYYKFDGASEITLITKDNVKLQAWYKPADKMTIFLHGNAGNLEDRIDKLKQLTELGYGFIIPAWRGFDKSEGTPTKDGLFLDAEAAINYLKSQNYNLANVIMIGESLGTGIATEMAIKHKFKGLFLITPYTSIADRAAELYPFLFAQYLIKDNFKVLDNIDKINQPLFMIHGTSDKTIPYQHSERIFAKANNPKKLVLYPGAGHNNYNVEDAFTQMKMFFTSLN